MVVVLGALGLAITGLAVSGCDTRVAPVPRGRPSAVRPRVVPTTGLSLATAAAFQRRLQAACLGTRVRPIYAGPLGPRGSSPRASNARDLLRSWDLVARRAPPARPAGAYEEPNGPGTAGNDNGDKGRAPAAPGGGPQANAGPAWAAPTEAAPLLVVRLRVARTPATEEEPLLICQVGGEALAVIVEYVLGNPPLERPLAALADPPVSVAKLLGRLNELAQPPPSSEPPDSAGGS